MIKTQHDITDAYQDEQTAHICQTEAELTRNYGRNTLAFFGLALQNMHFLTPDGEGLVNYQLTSNAAIVLGDPVCAPEAGERGTRSFLDFCALQHWRLAVYQTSPERLATYRGLNLHAFQMGEEAMIHPQTFTPNGSGMGKVTDPWRQARSEGV